MPTERNKALVRRFVAAADQRDFAAATACLASASYRCISPGCRTL